MVRIRGVRILPRPLTLEEVGTRLSCTLLEATALLHGKCFPHAFLDCNHRWRVPVVDVEAYACRVSNGKRHRSL
ncbi:MAG TPA: hypothetical protein VLT79_05865 [Gemmatimonadales bacterium]|nr:hypothetical protein [Gemmatimonadales bacterium]